MTHRQQLARLAAPAAFLLAVTVLVLLVRSAMSDDGAATTPTVAATTQAPPTTAKPKPVATGPTTTSAPAATYTIQSGDTLESIAAQYGTSVEALVTLNPDVDPTNLQVGQTIRVP